VTDVYDTYHLTREDEVLLTLAEIAVRILRFKGQEWPTGLHAEISAALLEARDALRSAHED
jgi:hypothetical protein